MFGRQRKIRDRHRRHGDIRIAPGCGNRRQHGLNRPLSACGRSRRGQSRLGRQSERCSRSGRSSPRRALGGSLRLFCGALLCSGLCCRDLFRRSFGHRLGFGPGGLTRGGSGNGPDCGGGINSTGVGRCGVCWNSTGCGLSCGLSGIDWGALGAAGRNRAVCGKLGAFRLGRRNHNALVRLRRNNGHHGHAGFLSATGAHFVNPVIELGNLGIKRVYALLQRAQPLVGLAQQLLVGFAGRFHLTHFVRRSASGNQRNAGQRHNNQCFHPGLQHKSILALKYRSMQQKPATDAHQKNFGPALPLARLL